MRREHLDAIPQLAHNPIKKQIIDAFFDKRNQHQGMVGSCEEITLEQFLMVMSHFRPLAHISREEERQAASKQKLRLLFNMHDKDSDGIITLAEYRKVVEELLSKSGDFGDQVAKAIARAAMLEAADKALDDFYEGITFEMFQLVRRLYLFTSGATVLGFYTTVFGTLVCACLLSKYCFILLFSSTLL
ncbi:tescalcin a isoform X1 [Syngnathus typhle]|uniref:tescalcin a isoform X1 n=1 Tax=Syngnathus typhle TaxID=161592 RepID=UPI002A6ADF5F|nr:tescalcin a isoform X1 [Syngnathus typhle]